MPYAEVLDVPEIVDHAHAILGSISLIQMDQSGARKPITPKTVFDSAANYLLAVLNMTRNTGF
jgi:hypothetical protein